MPLSDLINRKPTPAPWAEGEKIPWDDPQFSRRMLKEHLSQRHDAASRRQHIIRRQVEWIHRRVLSGHPARILDLGCGPGLYAVRLAEKGHTVHGIDFSPASVQYAQQHVVPGCTYALGDVRSQYYGSGYDLVMFLFGEFNVFRPADARRILEKCHAALKPGGQCLLELSSFDAVYEMGNQPATWYTARNELFAEDPHLCLMESFWDEPAHVAIERYFIIDAASAKVQKYASSTQAYEEIELDTLLTEAGFLSPRWYPSLIGKQDSSQPGLKVALAAKSSD